MTPELYHEQADLSTRQPGYYAIIPATVRYDEQIPANAKLLYGEISALLDGDGACFASNQYFANLFGWSCKTVSRLLSQLTNAGYVVSDLVNDDSGQVVGRKIMLPVSVTDGQGIPKIVHTPPQNCPVDQYILKEINKEKSESEKPRGGRSPKTDFDPRPIFVDWIDNSLQQLVSNVSVSQKNELYLALCLFTESRAAIKKAIPSRAAVVALLNRLVKFTKNESDRVAAMIDLLEVATASKWLTVYEPRHRQTSKVKPYEGRVYEDL